MKNQNPKHPNAERQAKLAILIAGISACISIASAFFSFQQVTIMGRQLEATDRPWLKVVGLNDVRLKFMGKDYKPKEVWPNGAFATDEMFGNFSIEIKNVGHSVATQIHVRSILISPLWKNGYSDVVKEAQQKFCETLPEAKDKSTQGDAVLFPDESYEAGNGSSVILDDQHVNHAAEGDFILAALVGCVDYQFRFSSEHHQTTFVYEFFRISDRSRFFPLGKDMGFKDILVIRNQQDDYAY